jgi:hypothetical protein
MLYSTDSCYTSYLKVIKLGGPSAGTFFAFLKRDYFFKE